MVAPSSRPPHWPGGIPREIQIDLNGDITQEQAIEECRGWFLFASVIPLYLIFPAVNKPRNNGSPVLRPMLLMMTVTMKSASDVRSSRNGQQQPKSFAM